MNKSIPVGNLPESNRVQILEMDEKELERRKLQAIYEFRRQRLLKIKKDFCNDSAAELSAKINRDASYISRALLPEGHKNKKRISDTMVTAVEAKFPGWLDKDGLAREVKDEESAAGALTSHEQTELLDMWALLLPEEKSEMLDEIRKRAKHNQKVLAQHAPATIENKAPPAIKKRTIVISERRKSQEAYNHADRRGKHHGK